MGDRKGKWFEEGKLEFEGEFYNNKKWKGKRTCMIMKVKN